MAIPGRKEKLAVAVFRLVREREKHSVPSNLPVKKPRQYLRRTICPMPLPDQAVPMSASAEKKWECPDGSKTYVFVW